LIDLPGVEKKRFLPVQVQVQILPSAPFGIRKGIRYFPGSLFLFFRHDFVIWGRFGADFRKRYRVESPHLRPNMSLREMRIDR
jgi:hypothetical protein